MKIVLRLFSSCVLCSVRVVESQEECIQDDSDKIDCPLDLPEGIQLDESICNFHGCCWQSDVPEGTPWCYVPPGCASHNCVPTQGKCVATETGYGCECYHDYTGPTCDTYIGVDYCPGNSSQSCDASGLISDEHCNYLGCCGDMTNCLTSDAPPLGPDLPLGQCDVDVTLEDECGYLGIGRDECWFRGCCWYTVPDQDGIPWCYKPDRCASQPCLNGGTCINNEGNYTCQCPDDHQGINCEGPTTTAQKLTTLVQEVTTESPKQTTQLDMSTKGFRHTTEEPVETTSEVVEKSTESLDTTFEPSEATTEPIQITSEPIGITTEHNEETSEQKEISIEDQQMRL